MLCRSLSSIEGIEATLAIGSWQENYFREVFDTCSHSHLMSVDLRNDPFSRNSWYTTKLPAIARDLKADIVHFAYPVPFGRKFHCPTVVTVHDLYAYEVPRNFKFAAANRAFLNISLRSCDAIICISRTTLEGLTKFVPEVAKTRLLAQIYNPIYPPETIATQEPIADLQSGRFLLSVGQHRPNKNLDLVQQTFAALRINARIPSDWRLVIVGAAGPQTTRLRSLARKLGLVDHIIYLSSITESQLAWLYMNCAVAVFPWWRHCRLVRESCARISQRCAKWGKMRAHISHYKPGLWSLVRRRYPQQCYVRLRWSSQSIFLAQAGPPTRLTGFINPWYPHPH
jgi:glycosyltransferase involved in cell wall biosynthesis